MSEQETKLISGSINFLKEATPPILKGAAVGVGLATVGLAGITWRNHREMSHQSLETHPLLAKFFDIEQRTYGMDTTVWAAVHRIHHHIPDATLYPFLRIARAVNKLKENPKGDLQNIPKTFKGLDPFVEEFTLDEVMEIGAHAEDLIRDQMKDGYKPPVDYSAEEIEDILYSDEQQYYYPDYPHVMREFSQEDLERVLLTDPHSPALVPPRNGHQNGFRGIFLNNVPLFKRPANVFKMHPRLKPVDLQREDDTDRRENKPYVVGSFVALSAAAFLLRGKYTLKDAVIAAAAGSAANGVRIGAGGAIGGMITNAGGHLGRLTPKDFVNAIFKREYKIKLNENGSVSTDTVNAGILGKLAGMVTVDEVGGQDAHHKHPDYIAYTEKEGLAAIFDAPYGSFTAFIAQSGVPLIEEGKQFGGVAQELRPDMPNPAMDIIWAARRRQMQASYDL